MKRTNLKNQSKKKRQEIRETSEARREFVEDMSGCCFGADCESLNVDVHEIARGQHRHLAVRNRITWLAVCRWHHEEFDDASGWPIERQLAMKLIRDPEYFDLVEFNRLRARADNAITLADITPYLSVR